MFRCIYSAATANVRVKAPGGVEAQSRTFDVSRGVVQGDIFSPVCFIIALECLFRRCDSHGGLSLVGVWLERLEYADDAALIDVGYEMASGKVSELARVAREQADMEISRPKTEYMARYVTFRLLRLYRRTTTSTPSSTGVQTAAEASWIPQD